jgi:uncharacterized OsmC-like protein
MDWEELCRSADRLLFRSIIYQHHDQGERAMSQTEDQAPNPTEFVPHTLAACLTTSLVYHAAARGIRIESLESQLEGDLDLRGFLGLSDDVRKGFQAIRARFTIKSDASTEQLEDRKPGVRVDFDQDRSTGKGMSQPVNGRLHE